MEINLKAKLSAYTLTSLKLAMQSKTNDGSAIEVYGYEGEEQRSIALSTTPSANKIVQYSSVGIIKSNDPAEDLDVVNKAFASAHYLNLQDGKTDEEMIALLTAENENKYVRYSGNGITYRAVLHTAPLVDPSNNQLSSINTNFYFNSEADMVALENAVVDIGGVAYALFGNSSLNVVVKLGIYGETFYVALLGRQGTDHSFVPIYASEAMHYTEDGANANFTGGWQVVSNYSQLMWGDTAVFGLPTIDNTYVDLFNALITIAPRYYTDEPFLSEFQPNKIYLVRRVAGELAYDATWYLSGTDVIDNVTSTNTNKPLSALQGKLLKDNFDSFKTWVEYILDSADEDLDELHEVIEFIKENKELILQLMADRVKISDIIDNLTSTSANKPLSANQGRVLKNLIDTLSGALELERADRTATDAILSGEISQETTRATEAEQAIAADVLTETRRATASESTLNSNKLDKRTNSTGVTEVYVFTNNSQGSVATDSAPTADTIMARDSSGRAQVTTPSANTDIANKIYVDNITNVILTNLNAESAARQSADEVLDNKLDNTVMQNSTLSYEGDTVNLNKSFINLESQLETTVAENINLANDTTAGLMSPSDVTAIVELQGRVSQLQGQTVRLLYTASQTPTSSDIASFVTAQGYTNNLSGVAVVVASTYHIWHYYENSSPQWKDDGVDTVTAFTNSNPGTIQGASSDGKVYAETDGTGSVYGWSDLKTRVTNAETAVSGQRVIVNQHTAELAQHDSAITQNTEAIAQNTSSIATKASVTLYNATIGTNWSGTTAPYTQNVVVNGILASDTPFIDLVTSSDWNTLLDEEYEWSSIRVIDTVDNGLVVYSDRILTSALNIQIKVIK